MSRTYPLPTPYNGNTAQDHADALRDNADLRTDGPLLDYLALAGADMIERLQAQVAAVTTLLKDTDGGDVDNDADIPVGEIRRMLAEAAR
jgi:hypothetical protein